ncbi:hypothetical protein JRQ81_007219 [Phrynocephalus forsythii]|uniref:Integral membrane protein 2 n=1 Tax=Phrynocephalus forsythii TaxID=171643 RepID=A0A9Q1ATB6_9SAUR|nr:hypothetical protein JRQ81_007219 [Phrynocephalus forsythii]
MRPPPFVPGESGEERVGLLLSAQAPAEPSLGRWAGPAALTPVCPRPLAGPALPPRGAWEKPLRSNRRRRRRRRRSRSSSSSSSSATTTSGSSFPKQQQQQPRSGAGGPGPSAAMVKIAFQSPFAHKDEPRKEAAEALVGDKDPEVATHSHEHSSGKCLLTLLGLAFILAGVVVGGACIYKYFVPRPSVSCHCPIREVGVPFNPLNAAIIVKLT